MTIETEPVEAEIVEPSEDLAVREPFTPAKVVGGIPYLADFVMLADRISRTAMVPSALRGKPDEVLAVIMYGSELGIGPMQALQGINFIEGKPSASAELLRALVMEAGHQFVLSGDSTIAIAQCRRKDWGEWKETAFTIQDAVQAGLCSIRDAKPYQRGSTGKPGAWEKYPDQMLAARVTSKACRMFFPDVVSGMSYVPEELEAISAPPPPMSVAPPDTDSGLTPTDRLIELLAAQYPERTDQKAYLESFVSHAVKTLADLSEQEVIDVTHSLEASDPERPF